MSDVPSNGLQWLLDAYDLGFCVLFARGLEAGELLARMGGEPQRAVALSRLDADALSAIGSPYVPRDSVDLSGLDVGDLERRGLLDGDDPVVRVGSCQGWAFAIEDGGARGSSREVVTSVSRGTKAVSLLRNINALTLFTYAEHGNVVCTFDVLLAHDRTGTAPDRLLDPMRQAGIDPEGDAPVRPARAMLEMAERHFGLGLPQQQLEEGELLTGRVSATRPSP